MFGTVLGSGLRILPFFSLLVSFTPIGGITSPHYNVTISLESYWFPDLYFYNNLQNCFTFCSSFPVETLGSAGL